MISPGGGSRRSVEGRRQREEGDVLGEGTLSFRRLGGTSSGLLSAPGSLGDLSR